MDLNGHPGILGIHRIQKQKYFLKSYDMRANIEIILLNPHLSLALNTQALEQSFERIITINEDIWLKKIMQGFL